MTINQELLKLIEVSDEKIDLVVTECLTAGALGAKLSGAGKGGCVIALAKDEQSSQVIYEAIDRLVARTTQVVIR
jgi:mevalonate kinase